MKYEEFKAEFRKQIGLNVKYFNPAEIKVLYDFLETIIESDFDKLEGIKEEPK